MFRYRWKSRPSIAALERNLEELRTVIIQLRRQLTNKTNFANGLQLALQECCTRIDELNGKLEQVRAQNRRLDEEAERLAEMVRLAP